MPPQLSQDEIAKYWEIFSQHEPVNGKLSGDKMFKVLQNSQLDSTKLERIWDLADIDGDGNMDFEEFCIAMRLVFDQLKAPTQAIPNELPAWLVPADKQHLVTAKAALRGQPVSQSMDMSANDDEDLTLSSDFNWYIGPEERRSYDSIYSVNSDSRGRVAYDDLTELYQTLENVPATDVASAWNIVNPRSDEKIDKEQCIVFLHVLNQRSKGVRIPRSVPPSLRATFGKDMPSYDVSSSQAKVNRNRPQPNVSNSKTSFADGYLSRLGLGGASKGYNSSGTDFSSTKDTDWEEVRLKRELVDLETRLEKIETAKKERRTGAGSNSGLVRRELQLLLEYKENQVKNKDSGADGGKGADLKQTEEEVQMISEQMSALKDHLHTRESQLQQLKAELAQL